jgi:hypothetical protein
MRFLGLDSPGILGERFEVGSRVLRAAFVKNGVGWKVV